MKSIWRSALSVAVFFCSFLFINTSFSDVNVIQINREKPFSALVLKNGKAHSLNVPEEIRKEIEEIYTKITFQDVNGDGVNEVVATANSPGAVNSCSKVYIYSGESVSLAELKFDGGELCNFRKSNNYLISAYRDGGGWREDVYKISNGDIRILYSDYCVGCGEIRRKSYKPDGTFSEYLVRDNPDFARRDFLLLNIISQKAFVFSGPYQSSLTSEYLVSGEKVLALKFEVDSDGEVWVEFRSLEGTAAKGWIKYKDFEDHE
jgi:hypothetical protein